MKLALACAAVVLTAPHETLAAVYKWVDEEGNVHYSQTLPPGQQGERIKAPPRVDTESAIKDLKTNEEGFDKRREAEAKKREEEQKLAAEAEERAKHCATLRENLSGFLNSQRIYEGEGDSRRRIGEEERQQRIKSTEEAIAKDCK